MRIILFVLLFLCVFSDLSAQNIEKYLFDKNWKVTGIYCSMAFNQHFSRAGSFVSNSLDNILSNRVGLSDILTFEKGFLESESIGSYKGSPFSFYQRDSLHIENKYLKVEYKEKINTLKIKKLTKKKLILIDENMSKIRLIKIDRSRIMIKKGDY